MFGSQSSQLSFDFGGVETPPRPGRASADRCDVFFAVLLDPGTASEAYGLARATCDRHGLKGQPRPARLLHMTVCGVGAFSRLPEHAVADARRAAETVELAAFAYRLDHILSFRHRQHPLVLCGDEGQNEFRMLHIQLARALRRAGLPVAINRSLKPHLTLAYGQREIARTDLATPLIVPVREFVLIQSFYGRGEHAHLGCWPLRQR